jgi:hypothetical protein
LLLDAILAGFPDRLIDFQNVVTVDGDPFHTVAFGADRKMIYQELFPAGGAEAIAIVLDEEYHR